MYFFPKFEPVHCSMSGSNCCFLTFIQVSQEAGKVVWNYHLFKNFPQFVVIYIVKGFSVVNEGDVFLEFSSFFYDPMDVGNLISGSPAFSKSSLYIGKFLVYVLLKPSLKDFEHYLACEMRAKDKNVTYQNAIYQNICVCVSCSVVSNFLQPHGL